LAYIPYGGADFGEIRAVADAVGDGDDGAYYDAWNAAGDRMANEGDVALAKGHEISARESYLRASGFYGTSFHPIYGAPVDPRLLSAFHKQIAALNEAFSLGPHRTEPIVIPYDATPMPGYFVPAQGFENDVRPLLVLNNGYDATITDTYFAIAVAA